jgi:MFS family permease
MPERTRVFVATLIFFVGFYALLAPLPPYLVDAGLTDWQVGLVLGAFGIAAVAGRPVAGLAADRSGRRTVILGGAAAFMLGVAVMLLHTGFWVLMGGRVLQALGYVAVTTAATARIADLAPPAQRGAALARFGIAANVAMTLTPATIGFLLPAIGLTGAFYAAIAAAAICGLLALGIGNLRAAGQGGDSGKLWALPRAIWQPWALTALLGVAFGVWLSYLPLLSERRGVEPVGVLYGCYGVAIIVTRLVTGPWQDRGHDRALRSIGFAATMAGLAIFAFTQSMYTYIPATMLVAAGGGILHPLLMAEHVARMPAAMRGRAVSTFYLAFDLGNGLGVWVLGFALAWWGLTALFAGAAGAALVGLVGAARGGD